MTIVPLTKLAFGVTALEKLEISNIDLTIVSKNGV